MKKIVIIALLFLFMKSMNAQDGLRFGFQLSPTVSWMTTPKNSVNTSGTNLGLKLALVGEYYFAENYAVTTGLGFHFNGGGTLLHENGGMYWTRTDLPVTLDTMSANVKLKYSIQYLEIPIGLKMKTKEFGYFRYFFDPAITIGFKTQSRGTVFGTQVAGEEEEKYDIRKEVNGLNLAWGLTAGAEYNLGENSTLIFGIGFQIGFTDVTDDNGTVFDPEGNRDENAKATTNGITLKLGVMF